MPLVHIFKQVPGYVDKGEGCGRVVLEPPHWSDIHEYSASESSTDLHRPPPGLSAICIQCDDLVKTYGGIRALDRVDLAVAQDDIVAVVGPNGAGKTTLIGAMTGFIRPDAGRCALFGVSIIGLPPFRVARLGAVRTFQRMRIVREITVMENMLLARPNQPSERLAGLLRRRANIRAERSDRDFCLNILGRVGLAEKAGLAAATLSYGQQKLVSLACCVASEARLIVLDEPLSGIHPHSISRILEMIVQVHHEGRCVVFVEHDLAAVRDTATRAVVMDRGRVLADGAPTKILNFPEVLEAFVAQ